MTIDRNSHATELPFLKNGIQQLAFVVEDLDRAVEHYWSLFRIGPWQLYTYGPQIVRRMTYRGQEVEHVFRVANSAIGDMLIELIQPVQGETIYRDFVASHGYGAHHVGVRSENAAQDIRQAEALGFRMIQSGEGLGPNTDGHYAYIDTEKELGILIELRQPPSKRWPPQQVYPR